MFHSIKLGPLCFFAITFPNIDRFWQSVVFVTKYSSLPNIHMCLSSPVWSKYPFVCFVVWIGNSTKSSKTPYFKFFNSLLIFFQSWFELMGVGGWTPCKFSTPRVFYIFSMRFIFCTTFFSTRAPCYLSLLRCYSSLAIIFITVILILLKAASIDRRKDVSCT